MRASMKFEAELPIGSLSDRLSARVRGQAQVITRLTDAIGRRELGVVPQRGARGAFIFAGPTGVGKTLLAQTMAQMLFGNERFERIDCSEFKTLSSYDAQFGNRAGDNGRIGEAFARVPEGVWLFDEIEKAHPEFVHIFLQAADAARLTLANGTTLDLSRLYLILTTNLGSALIIGRNHLPFTSIEASVCRAVEEWLRPELRGRFEKPFVFRPLDREAQKQIAGDYVNTLLSWNHSHGRRIELHPTVHHFLVCRGYSPRLGARPLLQVVDELIGNAIKEDLLTGHDACGTLIVSGERLIFAR